MSSSESVSGSDAVTGFGSLQATNISVARIASSSCPGCFNEINDYLVQSCKSELKTDLKIINFGSFEEFNYWAYHSQLNEKHNINVPFAFSIENTTNIIWANNKASGNIDIKYMTNSSDTAIYIILQRMLWKYFNKNPQTDIAIETSTKTSFSFNIFASMIAPMYIVFGINILCTIFVNQGVDDLSTNRRTYMLSCGLDKRSYWIGSFLMDIIILEIICFLIFGVHVYYKSTLFVSSYVISFIFLNIGSISVLLFSYVFSFLVKDKVVGTIAYLIVCSFIGGMYSSIKMVAAQTSPELVAWIGALIPILNIQSGFESISNKIMMGGTISLNAFLTDSMTLPFVVLSFGNIIVYSLIIWGIEEGQKTLHEMSSVSMYTRYGDFIRSTKAQQSISADMIEIERNFSTSSARDYSILINDVSKIFYSSSGNPICAVNQVSLGIKSGSTFGFLGANGAGKTTLLKMILKELPYSFGKIYVDGKEINDVFDSKQITICPQFNDHLTPELTGREQLRFFSYIFGIKNQETEAKIGSLIDTLDLNEHADKLLSEMSGGNQRKVSVALSFLSNSNIILLDEPTSSLDPVARNKVHNLINQYKGRKTFMLCTHLLEEAENICDNISIMINGCIYAYGTPQELSNKFGSEWRIEIALKDHLDETQNSVSRFFSEELPNSRLIIYRPISRIYSIPSSKLRLLELFEILDRAKAGNIGIKYYTCSCSSLENVFLEIVALSKQKKESVDENNEPQNMAF